MGLRGLLIFALLTLTGSARADQWALVVGISNYKDASNIRSLPTADADAKLIAKTLREVWQVPESHITLLTSDSATPPTRSQLITSLSVLRERVLPGDTVFLYLSGHATRVGDDAYFLSYDSVLSNKAYAQETQLNLKTVTRILQGSHGATVFIAWDIWQGSLFRQMPEVEPRTLTPESWSKCAWGQFLPASPLVVRQVTELYACSPVQQSYPQAQGQPGYFAHYLAKGLEGGNITTRSLTNFVIKEVTSGVQQKEGRQQVPYARVTGSPSDSVLVGKR